MTPWKAFSVAFAAGAAVIGALVWFAGQGSNLNCRDQSPEAYRLADRRTCERPGRCLGSPWPLLTVPLPSQSGR